MNPEPLTPSSCDLQDFPFMPLMVARLRKSKAWVKARRNPALGFYMLNLWMFAWHEVPAGSLEDDDDVLADAAMCEPAKWAKVRDDVLRGWVKCSDGRMYHPVVAERVLEAWASKVERRERTDHERERKQAERKERARLFDLLKSSGIHRPWNTGLAELRQAVQDLSGGQVPDIPQPVRHLSRLREGQGQGEGQGDLNSVANATGGEPPIPPPLSPPPKPSRAPADPEKARLWRLVKTAFVAQETCADMKAAGVLAGGIAAKYGNDVFLEAARAMEHANPVNAHTYLVGLCETAAGKRQSLNKQEALEQRNRNVAQEWAAEGDEHAAV